MGWDGVGGIFSIGEGEGDGEGETALGGIAGVGTFAPKLTLGNEVEAGDLAILCFDCPKKLRVITAVALGGF